ncbi:hypothetical protein [Bacteroides pyogenes]|uniref:Glycine zipper family protein n=6 Tax=Bacteroides pyogenes TaxID=310300 RepID=A0A5D3E8L8_9BACE|nr:hypothetical protein [Bacteroides pyogenes]TYK32483.1 hypothetical protein FNJ60_11740 [Bacteroides pyogenes]TYK48596.1 hypothetical protein FNG97_07140 [Bacteroides pyogenes]GAE19892.1 hypothetical protein JCM6294_3007 [Bacteroides pyogenes DSM 20611 = JCM 6294]
MKKKMLLLLLITVCCACDNSKHSILDNVQLEVNSTAQMFQTFNDSLLNAPHSSTDYVSTRGFWDSFKKALIVTGADIAGAGAGISATKEIAGLIGIATGGTGGVVACAVGGIICGAGASFAAFDAVANKASISNFSSSILMNAYAQIKEEKITYIKLDFPEKFKYINIMGGLHNSILEYTNETPAIITRCSTTTNPAIQLDNESLLVHESLQTTTNVVSNDYQKMESAVLKNEHFSQLCDNVMNEVSTSYVNNTFESSTLFEDTNTLLTENEKIIYDLYTEIYNTYPSNINEVIFIANSYIKRIERLENLTDTEKEKLYMMISVSVNSAYFWNK